MTDSEAILPDFCRLPRIAAVCGVAQVVVVLIFLSPSHAPFVSVQGFVFASAFAQWLALAAAVVLCKSRPFLNQFKPAIAFALAALCPALITACAAWLIYRLDQSLVYGISQGLGVFPFIGRIAIMVVLLSALLLRYFYIQEQWQEQVKANAKASLQALQARIKPHFLFNSMNTIAALVRKDAQRAETVIEDLSDLFRAALGDEHSDSSLAHELHLAKQYLAIEQLRLGPRLRLDWQIAEQVPMHIQMPRLLLQPLFENAIVHGIAPLTDGGVIAVVLGIQQHSIVLQIRNPLALHYEKQGMGHALHSVQQRLYLYFGSKARVSSSIQDALYCCEVRIPYE